MAYSLYYQAHVKKADTWFLTAILRSFGHLVFDRTLDKKQDLFEFFVPEDLEETFLQVMSYFQEQKIIFDLEKLPNRLEDPKEKVN